MVKAALLAAALLSADRADRLLVNYDTLVEKINPEQLVGVLFAKKVLTSREKDDIQARNTSRSKAGKLLDIIFTKWNEAFDLFVSALDSTEQSHLAELLKQPDVRPQAVSNASVMAGGVGDHKNTVPVHGPIQKLEKSKTSCRQEVQTIKSFGTGVTMTVVAGIVTAFAVLLAWVLYSPATLSDTAKQEKSADIPNNSDILIMTKSHQKQLLRAMADCVPILDPDPVMNRLISKEILLPREVDEIRLLAAREKQAERLLLTLLRKPDSAFELFLAALRDSQQGHIARKIEEFA